MTSRPLLLCALLALATSAHAEFPVVDTTFGFDGWKRIFEPGGGFQNDLFAGIARTSDGGYLVALQLPDGAAPGGARIGLRRLDRDGHNVTSGFGNNGFVAKDAYLTSVTDIAIDRQGRILVTGATPHGDHSDFAVVRFLPDGQDDTSFAGDGADAFGFHDSGDRHDCKPASMAMDWFDRVVVLGTCEDPATPDSEVFGLLRVNADGTLDTAFGTAGKFQATFKPGEPARAARLLAPSSTHFLVTGSTKYGDGDTDLAARVVSEQGPLPGSDSSLRLPIDVTGNVYSSEEVHDAIWTSSPWLNTVTALIVGEAEGRMVAVKVRLPGDGNGIYTKVEWDQGFVGNGGPGANCSACYVNPQEGTRASSAAMRADGKIWLVGIGPGSMGLAPLSTAAPSAPSAVYFYGLVTQLNADGSPDPGNFGNGDGNALIAAPGHINNDPAYATGLAKVLFNGHQPVLAGMATARSDSQDDIDGILTRLQPASDLIFADSFDWR